MPILREKSEFHHYVGIAPSGRISLPPLPGNLQCIFVRSSLGLRFFGHCYQWDFAALPDLPFADPYLVVSVGGVGAIFGFLYHQLVLCAAAQTGVSEDFCFWWFSAEWNRSQGRKYRRYPGAVNAAGEGLERKRQNKRQGNRGLLFVFSLFLCYNRSSMNRY